MTDPAFLARVATLLVARALVADSPDPGDAGRRVLDALTRLIEPIPPGALTARIAADERFAGEIRVQIIRAYAIPALARDLPDPAPASRPPPADGESGFGN